MGGKGNLRATARLCADAVFSGVIQKKDAGRQTLGAIGSRLAWLVPEEGVEPSRPEGHGILSPARLPVSPLRPEGNLDFTPLSVATVPAPTCRRNGLPEASGRALDLPAVEA